MKKIRVVKLSGSPYEMGWAHGQLFHDEIHLLTQDRVALCQGKRWTGRSLPREAVISLAEACVEEHQRYAKDAVALDDLMALTRDEEAICARPKPPMEVESCGAAIMCPFTGDFWSVWGLPAENEYEHFVI